MIKVALAKLLTLKAGAVVLAAGASGVALAAGTGVISTPLPTGKPAATTSATPGKADRSKGVDASHEPQGSPSPSLVGLCKALRAGAGAEHGKALENPAFTVLVTTAGGKDKVAGYCASLLGTSGSPIRPGNPGKGPDQPTGVPSERPADSAGQPTGTPGRRPSSPPSDRPND